MFKTFYLCFVILLCPSFAFSEAGKSMPTLEQTLSDEIVESPQEQSPKPLQDELLSTDTDTASIEILNDGVNPKRLIMLPGSTVVWKNNSSSSVIVNFIGKAISTTCKAPRGFSIGGKGVYSSSPIPPGGIASLCFLEPELYVYEVRSSIAKAGSESVAKVVGAVQIARHK